MPRAKTMPVVLTSRQRDAIQALVAVICFGGAAAVEFSDGGRGASWLTTAAVFVTIMIQRNKPRQPPKWSVAKQRLVTVLACVAVLAVGALIVASHHQHQIIVLLDLSAAAVALVQLARLVLPPATPAH